MDILSGIVTFCDRGETQGSDFPVANGENFSPISHNVYIKASEGKQFHNPKTKVTVALLGYVSNLEELKNKYQLSSQPEGDLAAIEELYSRKQGSAPISALDGVFSIFIWDENAQTGYLFQDRYGSNLPIYYFSSRDRFVFGSNLKEILPYLPIPREIDAKAAQEFLHTNREIPNEHTLIKGIFKLLPQQSLMVFPKHNKYGVAQIKTKPKMAAQELARNQLLPSIEKQLNRLLGLANKNQLGMALSSGYDTNFIASLLAKLKDKKITAITIGGKDVNEIPAAQKCADSYHNIKHTGALLAPDILQSLPDIVWRLEGYVCERGILLSYELASQFQQQGINCVFLGDGADQVLQPYSSFALERYKRKIHEMIKSSLVGKYFYRAIKKYKDDTQHKQYQFSSSFKMKLKNVKYDIILDYILKKNGIIFNSYGIQPFYPFLNQDTADYAVAIRKSSKGRKYYEGEVIKKLDYRVSRLLQKKGGSTDIGYILEGQSHIIQQLLDKECLQKLFTPQQKAELISHPHYYAEIILQILYIYLFDRLFISGKYDRYFHQPGLDVKLDEAIAEMDPEESVGCLHG